MVFQDKQKRTWAEINLDAVINNYKKIKKTGGKICCVVKANAYGHGAVELAKIYQKLGAEYLAVSNLEEAIQLRNADIILPILILGYVSPFCVKDLAKYKLTQTLYSVEYAEMLLEQCKEQDVKIKIHIKIDTGMGRIGFQYHDGIDELQESLKYCFNLYFDIEGIFTHFAIAEDTKDNFTICQAKYFKKAIEFFEKNGVKFKYKHCSNSAAILNYAQYGFDMVRAGILLYGISPVDCFDADFEPVLSLKTVVSNIKTIRRDDSVSYGRTFIADKEMKVATISVGYADGLLRSNTGNSVYINGKKRKILGRICMDQTIVEGQDVSIGDIVEIYGKHITVKDVARHNNTISYEILCSINSRVPRVYFYNGRIVEILDCLD